MTKLTVLGSRPEESACEAALAQPLSITNEQAGRLAMRAGPCPRSVLTALCSSALQGLFSRYAGTKAAGEALPNTTDASCPTRVYPLRILGSRGETKPWLLVWARMSPYQRATHPPARVPIELCILGVQRAGPHAQHAWAG